MEKSNENNEGKEIRMEEIQFTHEDKKYDKVYTNEEKQKQQGNDKFRYREEREVNLQPMDSSIDNDLRVVEKFQVPPNLKKTFIYTMVLAAVGIILIILGCINNIAEADPGRGVTFWVLGSIITIPGGFYSYQFWRAKRAATEEDREEILEQIPEL